MTPNGLFIISVLNCGELYKKICIVRLDLCLMCRLVSHYGTAPLALVDYYISSAWVGQGTDRAEYSAAIVRSVTGVYINVK